MVECMDDQDLVLSSINCQNTLRVSAPCNRACKLFNIHLYATLCFNYFRWHHRMFSCGSVFELLIC